MKKWLEIVYQKKFASRSRFNNAAENLIVYSLSVSKKLVVGKKFFEKSASGIVIFYTEMTRKVVLLYFVTSETGDKIHNSTFQVKISVWNVIFSNEMEK